MDILIHNQHGIFILMKEIYDIIGAHFNNNMPKTYLLDIKTSIDTIKSSYYYENEKFLKKIKLAIIALKNQLIR